MVLCRKCWNGRFFEYCRAEACYCEATDTILSLDQAEDDTPCEAYNEYVDSDDSEE